MEKSNFDRLLKRYLEDRVSEEEKTKIEAWLDSNKTKNDRNFIWEKEDEEILFQKITSNLDNVDEIVEFRPGQSNEKRIHINQWIKMAATVLLLLTVSYAIWHSVNTKPAVHQTIATSDIEKVILNDGTIVWLHKESKLIYYEKTEGIRQVSLVGEGLFEVAKDASRPFTISCGDVIVKVVGTSFSLKTGEESIELKVLTGKVNLSSSTDKAGVDVEPNEKVIYKNNGDIKKISMEESDISAITARTEYNMQFKNTTMESVIERIEKKFNIDVVVDNTQVNKCRITADFTDHSLEKTLVMIAELLEIDYTIKGSTVTITGKGCN